MSIDTFGEMCIRDNLETDESFRQWLKDKNNAPVGEARSIYSCPLANFLAEQCHVVLSVSISSIHPAVGGYEFFVDPPAWAVDFIARVDHGPSGESVTGSQALDILENPENYPYSLDYVDTDGFLRHHPEFGEV